MLASAVITAGLNAIGAAGDPFLKPGEWKKKTGKEQKSFPVSVFSKHLQWLDYDEMAAVAAEIGFDGIDLAVRPQGHVLPERAEEDLPKALEAIRKAGLDVYMIATSITSADDPFAEKILKTAGSLGIRHYRTGWMYYDDSRPVEDTLSLVQLQMGRLAELNEKYSISGEYQNHSGTGAAGIYFGGSVWDLAGVLKKLDSPWMGSQYDIFHATVEGANAWPVALKLISPYIRTLDIKDFQWSKKDGKWSSEGVPLGEGMVDYGQYLGLINKYNLDCPLSIHFEYPLGGAESGAKKLTMERETVIGSMRRDLLTLKKYLSEAGLI